MARERVDRLLVARGLFESRARAQAAIAAGRVSADGIVIGKASDQIPADAVIAAEPDHPYVSRGGVKLAAALDDFCVTVAGRTCIDVGTSTGGFAEVLLERGARCVYGVDVGTAQLHPRLHGRGGLVSIEQTDIRKLDPGRLTDPPDLAVVDVSFISLKLIIPSVERLLSPSALMLALIKPQFEIGRRSKGGIVRDATTHNAVCEDIAAFVQSRGWRVRGVAPSAILGGDGNREFFIAAERG